MADTTLRPNQTLLVCQTRRAKTARHWIDVDAVALAIERMGLKEPVRIRRVASNKSWWTGNEYLAGSYRHGWWKTPSGGLTFDHTGGVVSAHDINLACTEPPIEASRTLYHELRHAWQHEVWTLEERHEAKRAAKMGGRYDRRLDKTELDADGFEDMHDEWWPLATEL